MHSRLGEGSRIFNVVAEVISFLVFCSSADPGEPLGCNHSPHMHSDVSMRHPAALCTPVVLIADPVDALDDTTAGAEHSCALFLH